MDRLNSLMRGSMMGGSSAPPGAVSEPNSADSSRIIIMLQIDGTHIENDHNILT